MLYCTPDQTSFVFVSHITRNMSIFREETQTSMINQRLELKVEGEKNKQKGILHLSVLAFYDSLLLYMW